MKNRFLNIIMLVLMSATLSACAETQFASHLAKQVDWPGQTPNVGKYKVGKPYKVEGNWYYPKEDYGLVETGIASWYGPDFHGKPTANGERYDQYELTAAHRTLPMPSLVRVTNLENGRAIVVRINDRGPFKRSRVIDVSKRSAELLGFISQGTARVRVEVLSKESRQIAEAARRGMDTSRITVAELEKFQSISYTETKVATAQPMPRLINDAEALPDSLKTPTITIEELNRPDMPAGGATVRAPAQPVPGHVTEQGTFVPDAVVMNVPVSPTGIFIQAGSFGVYENAQRLQKQFGYLAPVNIDDVMVNGRKLYRVKLGPIANVATADKILAEVVKGGHNTAKVIKK